MSKQASSASLHVLQTRAVVPGGTQEEREREFERTLRQEGPFLVQDELDRMPPVPASEGLLARILQAIDVLRGRGKVYVERRHPRQ